MGFNDVIDTLDWAPEAGHDCVASSKVKNHESQTSGQNMKQSSNSSSYGRIISFGKDVASLPSSKINSVDFRGSVKGYNCANSSCRDVWNEYHDMGIEGVKAVEDYKVFSADSVLDLLQFVAPRMMKRGGAHYSYGIADNLDDKKYQHYRYWSNPLETRLPKAPEMEMFA